jgi:hypothetical protein
MALKILKVLLERVIGFLVFLILLAILNMLSDITNNSLFSRIVDFFNNNIIFLAWITLIMLIGEIFLVLKFPLNTPGPIFNAIGGSMIVIFLGRIFFLLVDITPISLGLRLISIFNLVSVLVFFIVLIVQYSHILSDAFKGEKKERKVLPKKVVGKRNKTR